MCLVLGIIFLLICCLLYQDRLSAAWRSQPWISGVWRTISPGSIINIRSLAAVPSWSPGSNPCSTPSYWPFLLWWCIRPMFLSQSTSAWLGNFSPKCVAIIVQFLIDLLCILWIGTTCVCCSVYCSRHTLCLFSLSDLKRPLFSMHSDILPDIWDRCLFRCLCMCYIMQKYYNDLNSHTVVSQLKSMTLRFFLLIRKFHIKFFWKVGS